MIVEIIPCTLLPGPMRLLAGDSHGQTGANKHSKNVFFSGWIRPAYLVY